jgi:hypothetical protein
MRSQLLVIIEMADYDPNNENEYQTPSVGSRDEDIHVETQR